MLLMRIMKADVNASVRKMLRGTDVRGFIFEKTFTGWVRDVKMQNRCCCQMHCAGHKRGEV